MHPPTPSAAPRRAAIYLRVSTSRQAETDLSIPDQRAQIERYCRAQAIEIVEEHVDAGESARSDNRPAFQSLIERASDTERPFDAIIVHSFSRFFRDSFGYEAYARLLAKHGVELISITQQVSGDPSGVLARRIFNLFDEYQSLRTPSTPFAP